MKPRRFVIEFEISNTHDGALWSRMETYVDVRNPALSQGDIGAMVRKFVESADTPAFLRELRDKLSIRKINEQVNPFEIGAAPVLDNGEIAVFPMLRGTV